MHLSHAFLSLSISLNCLVGEFESEAAVGIFLFRKESLVCIVRVINILEPYIGAKKKEKKSKAQKRQKEKSITVVGDIR